jgi:hypothetical protein
MEEATAAALQNPKAVAQAIEAEIGKNPEDPLSQEMMDILKKETKSGRHGPAPKVTTLPGDKPVAAPPLSQEPAAQAAKASVSAPVVVTVSASVKGKEKASSTTDPIGHAESASGLHSSEEALYAEVEAEKAPITLPDVQPSIEEPGVPHDPQDVVSDRHSNAEAKEIDLLRQFIDENAKATIARFTALEERVEAIWAMYVGLERKVARIDQTRGARTDISNTVSIRRAHLKRLSGEIEVPGEPSTVPKEAPKVSDPGVLMKPIREFLRATPYPKVKAARQIRLKALAASLGVTALPDVIDIPSSGWTEAGLFELFSAN